MKRLLIDSSVFTDAFDPASRNHEPSIDLLEELRRRKVLITMPAHGWFEVQCALQKMTAEKRFVGPRIVGVMNYPVELIHIDEQFIRKYAMADIPYIKAGDHIFVAVAKINDWPLVTNDVQMIDISAKCGVKVFSPAEFRIVLDDYVGILPSEH